MGMLAWVANLGWAGGQAEVLVAVPDVVGQTQAAGTATLQGAGFTVVVVTAPSNSVPAGTIISQVPAGGSMVSAGSVVTITVSSGDIQVTGGGWWNDYESAKRQAAKRRKARQEAEEAAQALQDETDREIARLLHEQEARDADKADMARLQGLADQYAGQKLQELPKVARVAILNAQDARTRNALEQMQRVMEQELDQEMIIALQQILLMLDTD